PEVVRSMMTPDEVMRMGEDEALIFTSGQPAIYANKLRYFKQPLFIERAKTPPPRQSDRIIRSTADPSATPSENIEVPATVPPPPLLREGTPAGTESTNPGTGKAPEQQVLFLRTSDSTRNCSESDKGGPLKPPQRLM